MTISSQDTMKTRRTLNVAGKEYDDYSLPKAKETIGDISKLTYTTQVLLENLMPSVQANSIAPHHCFNS